MAIRGMQMESLALVFGLRLRLHCICGQQKQSIRQLPSFCAAAAVLSVIILGALAYLCCYPARC